MENLDILKLVRGKLADARASSARVSDPAAKIAIYLDAAADIGQLALDVAIEEQGK